MGILEMFYFWGAKAVVELIVGFIILVVVCVLFYFSDRL